jgi:hypothetical protein
MEISFVEVNVVGELGNIRLSPVVGIAPSAQLAALFQ